MTGQNYFLLAYLPVLGDLGSSPPITPGDLFKQVAENAGPKGLIETILLSDDLVQRQAYLAGEITKLNLSVLTDAQGSDEQPLPPYLEAGTGAEADKLALVDDLWATYFRYAAKFAKGHSSRFLAAWVTYEVSLRNAVVTARAKTLELDPYNYAVCTELVDTEQNFTSLINNWSAAANPLAGLKVLDKARWDWLVEHDSWFKFNDDELAAYTAKLILLYRADRLTQAEQAGNIPISNENNR